MHKVQGNYSCYTSRTVKIYVVVKHKITLA
jgi:hypothetical protein